MELEEVLAQEGRETGCGPAPWAAGGGGCDPSVPLHDLLQRPCPMSWHGLASFQMLGGILAQPLGSGVDTRDVAAQGQPLLPRAASGGEGTSGCQPAPTGLLRQCDGQSRVGASVI